MTRELKITGEIVEQPAKDPYLCPWADWYFTVLLTYMAQTDTDIKLEQINIDFDYTKEKALIVSKNTIDRIPVLGVSHSSSVRLGAATSLILTGSLQNMIIIPNRTGGFSIGRRLETDFSYFNNLYWPLQAQRQLQAGGRKDSYLEAQHSILETGKVNFGASSYRELFEIAKQLIIGKSKI
jgi:hypothetical protein